MYDPLTLSILAGIFAVLACVMAFSCSKRYEIAIFLIILSPLISAILLPDAQASGSEQEAGIGGYIRICLVLIIGAVGFFKYLQISKYLQTKWLNHDKLPIHFIVLFLYLILALLSVSYSIDKQFTMIRSISFISFFGFLLGLHACLKNKEQLDIMLNACFWAMSFCLIINIISIFVIPEKAWWPNATHRLRGLFSHPNTLGSFCMMSYPVFSWKYFHCDSDKKWLVASALLLFVILHLLSGSRTSLGASIFCLFIWLAILKKRKMLLTISGAIVVLTGLIFNMHYSPESFARQNSSSPTTLTGRTKIWTAAATLAAERPIFGYGYSVSGKIFEDYRFYDKNLSLWSGNPRSSLHNGYISVFIGLGSVGLILFCLCLYLPLHFVLLSKSSKYKTFVISIMLMLFLVNLFETAIIGGASIDSVIFWIAWVIAGRLPSMTTDLTDKIYA